MVEQRIFSDEHQKNHTRARRAVVNSRGVLVCPSRGGQKHRSGAKKSADCDVTPRGGQLFGARANMHRPHIPANYRTLVSKLWTLLWHG
ncbi:unnamed protein product, partial [Iphiclides podalirius]